MWLHIPPEFSVSAQGSEGSISQSKQQPDPILFVTLSGKASPRPYSWKGWGARSWIKLLSGTILQPLTANRGAELWISSLQDSPASPSAMPGNGGGQTMSGGSGVTLCESFARYDPGSSSWRTSQESFLWDSVEFLETWPGSGSMLSGLCFERRMWVPRTSASGGSAWATPTSRDWKDGACAEADVPINGLLGRQVVTGFSHQNQTTDQDGESSSSNTRKLNPLFVEMLMGYPIGWTGFEGLGMPWSLYRQRLRSAYLQIVRG